VHFAENVLEDPDLPSDLEDLTAEEYAQRKAIIIANPLERRIHNVAGNGNGNGKGGGMTKADLQDACDQVQQILEDAYAPESSREDLAAAIGAALDILENGPADDDTDGDEDDDDPIVTPATTLRLPGTAKTKAFTLQQFERVVKSQFFMGAVSF
jgi:hypothetical protein